MTTTKTSSTSGVEVDEDVTNARKASADLELDDGPRKLYKPADGSDSEAQPLQKIFWANIIHPRDTLQEKGDEEPVFREKDEDNDLINTLGSKITKVVEHEMNKIKLMLEKHIEKLFSDFEARVADDNIYNILKRIQAGSYFRETIDGKKFLDVGNEGFEDKLRKVREDIREMEKEKSSAHTYHTLLFETIQEFQCHPREIG